MTGDGKCRDVVLSCIHKRFQINFFILLNPFYFRFGILFCYFYRILYWMSDSSTTAHKRIKCECARSNQSSCNIYILFDPDANIFCQRNILDVTHSLLKHKQTSIKIDSMTRTESTLIWAISRKFKTVERKNTRIQYIFLMDCKLSLCCACLHFHFFLFFSLSLSLLFTATVCTERDIIHFVCFGLNIDTTHLIAPSHLKERKKIDVNIHHLI